MFPQQLTASADWRQHLARAKSMERQSVSFAPLDFTHRLPDVHRAAYTAPANAPGSRFASSVKMRSAVTEPYVKSRAPTFADSLETDAETDFGVAAHEPFRLALQQLPDFQLTRQLTMPSYVSPRHQPCLGPALSLTINPIGLRPPCDQSLCASEDDATVRFEKSEFRKHGKSRYMWIDSLKQWIELDSVLVPYVNFIRTMKLCERDIAQLERMISKHGKNVEVCLRFLEHFRVFNQRLFPEKVQRQGQAERRLLESAKIVADPPYDLVEEEKAKPAEPVRKQRLSQVVKIEAPEPEQASEPSEPEAVAIATSQVELPKATPSEPPRVREAPRRKLESRRGSQKPPDSSTFKVPSPEPEMPTRVYRPADTSSLMKRFSRVDFSAELPRKQTETADFVRRPSVEPLAFKTASSGNNAKLLQKKSATRRNSAAIVEPVSASDVTLPEEHSIIIEEQPFVPRTPREIDAFMEQYLSSIQTSDINRKESEQKAILVVKKVHRRNIPEFYIFHPSQKAPSEFDSDIRIKTTVHTEHVPVISGPPVADSRPDKQLGRTNTKLLLRSPSKRESPVVKTKRPQAKAPSPNSGFLQVKPRAQKPAPPEEPPEEKHVAITESVVEIVEPEAEEEAEQQPEVIEEPEQEEEPKKHPLLLPKLEARLSSNRKKRLGKPKRDTSLSDELERQRKAEAIKQKFRDALEIASVRPISPLMGAPDEPIYDDYGWLAKYCIFNSGIIEMYRRAFDALDDGRRGWLKPDECMMAIRGVNSQLGNSELKYLYQIIELLGRGRRLGIDFKLFSVIAGLAQRIAALDNWMRTLMDKTDLSGLEMKIYLCLKLWECSVDELTKKLPIDKLCLELKAGGVSPYHEQEVRHRLGWMKALDILDYLTYMPLFIMIHESVIENPLADERDK